MFLAFMLFSGAVKIEPMLIAQAATKSSSEKKIEELENNIKKWEKELAEYEKKADKAIKGAIGVIAGAIEIYDPLIIQGGITNWGVPYLHVTNYTPNFMEGMIGAISGFFRKTGTYTYEFKGKLVPDYEKVYEYEDERKQLKNKISKAKKELESLKADLYAEFVLYSESKITLAQGQYFTIWYELSSGVSDSTITWTSSDKTVATVSKDGLIRAKGIGKAKITGKAKINGKTITVDVTVKEKAKSVSLKTKSLELAAGETKQLKATLSPAKSYAAIWWEHTDRSVVQVDDNGIITAIAPGTAYVYAHSYTPDLVSNICKVTVTGKDILYKNATSRESALSLVKASGYLEEGKEYYFETMVVEGTEGYIINAYPDVDECIKVFSGISKKTIETIEKETYYMKHKGKKVYCLDNYNESDWTYDIKDYTALKGLKFKTESISVPQNAYQKLVLEASNVGQFDYLRITSENPDIAQVVFSEKTGEPYVQGNSQGETTITAETRNGQKAVLKVEVGERLKTEEEVLKEAEDEWVKENTTRLTIEPGDESSYDNMNTYSWWSDWYAADDSTKIEMFYDSFNYSYEEKSDAYAHPEEWIKDIIYIYLGGMDQTTVQKKYEEYRNIYENGYEEEIKPNDYKSSWKYESYIDDTMEKYEKETKQYMCSDPITAETYQKNHKSSKSYKEKSSIPFNKYYVLLEKDSNTIVFAAQEWYKMKEWLIGEKFLK